MPFRYLLLLILLHEAYSYYFYNPLTHRILNLPSLRGIPDGYKLIPPPRSQDRRNGKGRNAQPYCTEAGFRCTHPYERAQTYQFECEHDAQCPSSYICCAQKCFQHKICVIPKLLATKSHFSSGIPGLRNDPGNFYSNSLANNPGTCSKYNFTCPRPFHYDSTVMFKCVSDKQCPKTFKCCQQSCFAHKICSRSIPNTPTYIEEMRKKEEQKANDSTETENITDSEDKTTELETEETIESTTPLVTASTEIGEEDLSTEIETTTDGESTTAEENEDYKEEEEYETEERVVENVEAIVDTITTEMETSTAEETAMDTDAVTERETTDQVKSITTERTIADRDNNDEGSKINQEGTENHIPSTTSYFRVIRSTVDPNSIVPEYSAYYYDYDSRNETEDDYTTT